MPQQTKNRQRTTRPRPTTRIRGLIRGHRVLAALTAVLLVVVLAAVTGELVAEHMIRDKIAGKVPSLGNVSVSENGSLALWDVLHKHIPELDITSSDATIGQLTQVGVSAQLDDVALGATPTVTSVHAEINVPTQSIADAIQAKAPSVKVSGVTTDPAAGTVTAAIGPGGIGQLTLKPALTDGKVTFSTTSLTIMGAPVPLSMLGQAGSGLGSGPGTQQAYPLGLKANSLTVGSTGVQVTLIGGPSALQDPVGRPGSG